VIGWYCYILFSVKRA